MRKYLNKENAMLLATFDEFSTSRKHTGGNVEVRAFIVSLSKNLQTLAKGSWDEFITDVVTVLFPSEQTIYTVEATRALLRRERARRI